MHHEPGTAASCSPTAIFRLLWAVQAWPTRMRYALADLLMQAVVLLAGGGNLISHARRELPTGGGDEMQAQMNRGLLQLLAAFSMQGHSGFSASYATSALAKLMRFEPLGPLTGEDDEWCEVTSGTFQNRRCSHVFKKADRFDGQPYDIYARVFREPDGACYTNGESRQPITFPYTPQRVYVDVPTPH